MSDPTRIRRHYSLSAREVDILQRALTALATHTNGMGDIGPDELVELSDYLGVIPVDPPAAPAVAAPSITTTDTAREERS